jgi:hypothetical protein
MAVPFAKEKMPVINGLGSCKNLEIRNGSLLWVDIVEKQYRLAGVATFESSIAVTRFIVARLVGLTNQSVARWTARDFFNTIGGSGQSIGRSADRRQ